MFFDRPQKFTNIGIGLWKLLIEGWPLKALTEGAKIEALRGPTVQEMGGCRKFPGCRVRSGAKPQPLTVFILFCGEIKLIL